jgi:tetratricopeptide (TPR) repeat protein
MSAALARAIVFALLLASVPAASGPLAAGPAQTRSALDAAVAEAFGAVYNLDHAQAMTAARRAVAIAPEESRAHRTLASIIWLHILFTRGAVSIDHYMGNLSGSHVNLPKPPADLDAEFKRELTRAIDLAEARRNARPEDPQAMFDVGAAYGLQASYIASVEGRLGSAFQSARRAFNAQESVLERDPRRADAGVIIGTYRYLVSTMSMPTRWLAYVAGFGGGKERGIAMLEAAARQPDVSVDARTALMLIYSREGRHHDVVRLARELSAQFPRNRLFVLEEGAAAIRAGRAAEAEAALTKGLAMFAHDDRAKVPGERALWLYKRGLARLGLNRLPDAVVDLREALGAGPVGWVGGRIHVALGKIADLGGHREDALAAYRTGHTMCQQANDRLGAAEATRLMRRPFTMASRGTSLMAARR